MSAEADRAAPTTDHLAVAWDAAVATVRGNIADFTAWYPDDTTSAGAYRPRAPRDGHPEGANVGWTTGFWPGMLWLVWEATGDDAVLAAARRQVDNFADRVTRGVDLDTHDLGFLYTLSCVTPWRLLGDERARDAALAAADHLMTRFLEPAGIVQAWGDLANPVQRGRTIIDSLMNLPLLYWAAETTGAPAFREAAIRHTEQLRRHIIRPDGTTFHTFYWDTATGEPLRGATEQGHQDASCWARGQAWGVYGFALGYRHVREPSFLDAARRCADYFLTHLPDDRVAYWDLVFGDGSGEERDSSAAAIAVCGLYELAEHVDDPEAASRYRAEADAVLTSLTTGYSTAHDPASTALLLHGVYDKPKNVGVDEGNLWGDYFYLEALSRRLRSDWRSYW
ncbi:unsaturated chondroitin disaccharide hydrolase [Saccharothrix saharensis]|uniref:Unsaturated chondroitin disaccharide hydrolase n=1 Tax=Saccharothrix saharensis TaxID=571190 RepID=A0A543JQB4_9PSEU|nr:glycoside hydrolase family 88 protein [Saccharothrix saharensis]TQM85013.1 unsaturated chondroitin disaccharide hydrolase [Saccharothrix saharensis]